MNVTDRANLNNETKRSRSNAEGMGLPNAFGLESSAAVAAAGISPDKLIAGTSTSSSDGSGSVQRNETVTTNIAAIVNQVLPNGNLVVEGKQEIRINFEVRELIVAGGGPAGGHRIRQLRSIPRRSPRPASPMAVAVRSPMCSSPVTASSSSTSCFRSKPEEAGQWSVPGPVRARSGTVIVNEGGAFVDLS